MQPLLGDTCRALADFTVRALKECADWAATDILLSVAVLMEEHLELFLQVIIMTGVNSLIISCLTWAVFFFFFFFFFKSEDNVCTATTRTEDGRKFWWGKLGQLSECETLSVSCCSVFEHLWATSLALSYWAISQMWFARVNALCNLSHKKPWKVARTAVCISASRLAGWEVGDSRQHRQRTKPWCGKSWGSNALLAVSGSQVGAQCMLVNCGCGAVAVGMLLLAVLADWRCTQTKQVPKWKRSVYYALFYCDSKFVRVCDIFANISSLMILFGCHGDRKCPQNMNGVMQNRSSVTIIRLK